MYSVLWQYWSRRFRTFLGSLKVKLFDDADLGTVLISIGLKLLRKKWSNRQRNLSASEFPSIWDLETVAKMFVGVMIEIGVKFAMLHPPSARYQ